VSDKDNWPHTRHETSCAPYSVTKVAVTIVDQQQALIEKLVAALKTAPCECRCEFTLELSPGHSGICLGMPGTALHPHSGRLRVPHDFVGERCARCAALAKAEGRNGN